jgi:membrane protease YdiL (CAAX protease family)
MLIKRYPLPTFFALTFLISWGIWIPLILSLDLSGGLPASAVPLATLGVFGPSIAGLLMSGLGEGWEGVKALLRRLVDWRSGGRWYLVIGLGVPLLYLLSLLVFVLTRDEVVGFDPGRWATIFPILAYGLLSGPLGEELGWRGFALPRLLRRWNALLSSLVLGLVWGAWHLPLFFWEIPGLSPPIPFANYLLSIIAFAILITWAFQGTRGSLFVAVFFHLWMNSVASYVAFLFPGLDPSGFTQIKNWLMVVAALGVVGLGGLRTQKNAD